MRYFVEDFRNRYGDLRADAVKKFPVEEWVRTKPTWGPSTERMAKERLSADFGWAVALELLDRNPVKGVKKPPVRSRGANAVVSPTSSCSPTRGEKPETYDYLELADKTLTSPKRQRG